MKSLSCPWWMTPLLYLFVQIVCWSRINVECFSTVSSSITGSTTLSSSSATTITTLRTSTRSAQQSWTRVFQPSSDWTLAVSNEEVQLEELDFDYDEENYDILVEGDDDDEEDDIIVEEEISYGYNDPSGDNNNDLTTVHNQQSDASVSSAPMKRITMSDEQRQALEYIKHGENVFLTGVAGTGKSMVLNAVLDYLSSTLKPKQFVALGPTGAASVAIEGQTIHSFAALGIPSTYQDFEKTKRNKAAAKNWRALKVMVIDEISMVSGEFFDLLSTVVSDIRKDPRPFGGIQLVVCGDFLQLSPIPTRKMEMTETINAMMEGQPNLTEDDARDLLFLNRGFCFQSQAWVYSQFKVVELRTVFRQTNRDFVNALQDIRRGYVSQQTMTYLRDNCERPLPLINDVRPTILYSTNINVNSANLMELNKLPGEKVTYHAVDKVEVEKGVGKWAGNFLEKNQFFRTCIAESELQLKLNAQVMLIMNMKKGSKLVNGSRGIVIGFRAIKGKDSDTLYPVVKFVDGVVRTIGPQQFSSRIVGVGRCIREAVPLKLAYALTCHKSQGLTLDYVIADFEQVFADSQVYVALSRARDAQGLELRNFSSNRVRANPVALCFYEDPTQDLPFWWELDGRRSRSDLPPSIIGTASKVKSKKAKTKRKVKKKKKKSHIDSDDKQLTTPSRVRVRQSEASRSKSSRDSLDLPTATSVSSKLDGQVFVFVGVLEDTSIEAAEAAVRSHGGLVRQRVSTRTDFLVLGRNLKNGKKATLSAEYNKARAIIQHQEQEQMNHHQKVPTGLRILSEEQFIAGMRKQS